MRRLLDASLLMLALAAPAPAGAKVEKRTFLSRDKERTYSLFVPPGISAEHPAALIVMLHGSGRDGKELVDLWTDLAGKEGIVLAGPDSLQAVRWASPEDGPLLLRDLVEEIKSKYPIDPRRVYLFGHSAGAVFALQMACLESEYFAAAAISAGAIEASYYSIFDFSARKIPFIVFIGTRDQFFSLPLVDATVEALKARGFPVTYKVMLGHTHNYASKSKEINAQIWELFSHTRLDADPSYRVYADPK
jgi:poly(3-hydroxybutyrate) depolymerase